MGENPAALRAAVFFAILEKPEGGGGGVQTPPPPHPSRARVKLICQNCSTTHTLIACQSHLSLFLPSVLRGFEPNQLRLRELISTTANKPCRPGPPPTLSLQPSPTLQPQPSDLFRAVLSSVPLALRLRPLAVQPVSRGEP